MSQNHPTNPTPKEIWGKLTAEIRAGWPDWRWEKELRKQGVRDVEVRSPEGAIAEYQRGEW